MPEELPHWWKEKKKQERQQYWLTRMRRRLMVLRLLKKPKENNQNTFKYTTSEPYKYTSVALIHTLPRQLFGNTVIQGRRRVYPPYSKYIMLIRWFWQEPIRHDLHWKTAFILSSHRECVCLKSVNKYRSEGRKRRRLGLLQKEKKKKCMTTGNLQSPTTLQATVLVSISTFDP